jgi:molybdopterin synthase sulfur carrier subunit
MKVKVLFFGVAKDISEVNSIDLELKKDSNVFDFIQIIKERYSGFSSINDFTIAVNEEYAKNDIILNESDTVAIIPPVSGG